MDYNAILHRCCDKGKFRIKKAYLLFLPRFQKVQREGLVLGPTTTPKHKFIFWLALQGRLATVDRLQRWGIYVQTCQNSYVKAKYIHSPLNLPIFFIQTSKLKVVSIKHLKQFKDVPIRHILLTWQNVYLSLSVSASHLKKRLIHYFLYILSLFTFKLQQIVLPKNISIVGRFNFPVTFVLLRLPPFFVHFLPSLQFFSFISSDR